METTQTVGEEVRDVAAAIAAPKTLVRRAAPVTCELYLILGLIATTLVFLPPIILELVALASNTAAHPLVHAWTFALVPAVLIWHWILRDYERLANARFGGKPKVD